MSYSSFFFKKSVVNHVTCASLGGAAVTGSVGYVFLGTPGAIVTAIPGLLVGSIAGLFSGISHGAFVSLTRKPKSEEELKSLDVMLSNMKTLAEDEKKSLLNDLVKNYETYKANSSTSSEKLIHTLKDTNIDLDNKIQALSQYMTETSDGRHYYNNGKLLFNLAYYHIIKSHNPYFELDNQICDNKKIIPRF